jgi:protein AATF/BFR2
MRGELQMDGKEYMGRTTSRKQFKRSKRGGGDILDALDSDDDEVGGSGSDDTAGGSDDDRMLTEGDDDASEGDEESEQQEGQSGSDDESERGAERAGGSEEQLDDEEALLEREYEQLRAEEAAAVEGLKAKLGEEREKGVAVKDQRRLWDRMVELRILLQKVVPAANRLPRPSYHKMVTRAHRATAAAFEELATEAAETLRSSVALMRTVMGNNPAVAEAAAAVAVEAKPKSNKALQAEAEATSTEERWKALDACHGAMMPFVRHAVDSWQRKATAARGGAGSGALNALGQSVSLQVCMYFCMWSLYTSPWRRRCRLLTNRCSRILLQLSLYPTPPQAPPLVVRSPVCTAD